MRPSRRCSRIACGAPAVATLTYAYADSTAVVGPLATYAEPHCYDLCEQHAARLTAPRGWEVLRQVDAGLPAGPSADDLEALADAVRAAGRQGRRPPPDGDGDGDGGDGARRGHLRAVRSSG
ncbi:MAG: DUF3499 domain-containing protein [Mycobacteriales bacterium]